MSDLERQREKYSPFTEVYITEEEDGEEEIIYIGHIEGTSILRTWGDESGETKHVRYLLKERVSLPQEMTLQEVISWVESGPEELSDTLENNLPEDLGDTIGISEYYPQE